MIKPVVEKKSCNDKNSDRETVTFWLGKTVEERMDAMGELHLQQLIIQGYSEIPKIQKVVKKIKTEL